MILRTTLGCLALLAAMGCDHPSEHSLSGSGGTGGEGTSSQGGSGGMSLGGRNAEGGRGGSTGGQQTGADAKGLNDAQRHELDALRDELDAVKDLDAAGLRAKHALGAVDSLSYDPRASQFLDRIQASALALDAAELERLGKNGFVISKRGAFPTFVRGYAAIYSEDLPVYISADAILEAVHSSFDSILMFAERNALRGLLVRLLGAMHLRLPSLASQNPASAADLDVYLAVARSLLYGTEIAPVAGGDAKTVHEFYQLALAADGLKGVTLFGQERLIDASQFTPRGHYTQELELSQYFRAMMWLGRTDFRLIETNADGSQEFLRPQYDAMLLLRKAMVDEDLKRFQQMDAALQAFMGESDYMTVPQVDSLIADLGGLDAASSAADSTVEAAIRAGGYGIQRIASQVMVNGGSVDTLPLARSFAFFGQRYVLDSHVFSQVVYDRLPAKRMMPNPLDVAFAALGNDRALGLLGPELGNFPGYPGALEGARLLTEAHGAAFWSSNLYNLWLASLRALSPTPGVEQPAAAGMPQVTGTEAWGRRILNTQLGSWAELRHDTLLYAKQSYTGIPACDYPDAYVDPYPEFYERLRLFAEHGQGLADTLQSELGLTTDSLRGYFATLGASLATLEGMAKNQREGVPFSDEQMAFVNRAVRLVPKSLGCASILAPDGWLADMYYVQDSAIEASPTIADVHTQPADEGGGIVGKVLHVGTGYPRLMVTTVDTCQGPRAYAGVTFAYHEEVTKDFVRLTDEEWTVKLGGGTPPADVSWMTPVIGQ